MVRCFDFLSLVARTKKLSPKPVPRLVSQSYPGQLTHFQPRSQGCWYFTFSIDRAAPTTQQHERLTTASSRRVITSECGQTVDLRCAAAVASTIPVEALDTFLVVS
jgi:hypothetical protein